uniref:Uncharacterized protein n=1 Tax=Nelumbo nucifera TaxID=4432 RepID=A0A822XIK2_NELNU|nr:TPA_asm: hypothetical protein HUJ06_020333 [Nelumbo nucifera]
MWVLGYVHVCVFDKYVCILERERKRENLRFSRFLKLLMYYKRNPTFFLLNKKHTNTSIGNKLS